MPRPKKETDKEPKKRSRTGCWPCKARKVKCGEEKPACANCVKAGERCDYSIRLNWGGRTRRDPEDNVSVSDAAQGVWINKTPPVKPAHLGHEHVFSSQHLTSITPSTTSSHRISTMQTLQHSPLTSTVNAPLDPLLGPPGTAASSTPHSSNILPGWRHSPVLAGSTSSPGEEDDFHWSAQHRHKRQKSNMDHNRWVNDLGNSSSTSGTGFHFASPGSLNTTPGSSSFSQARATEKLASTHAADLTDVRRLSVRSLLSDPSEEADRPRSSRSDKSNLRLYGFDHGFPDLDVPRNNDTTMVLPRSPDMRRTSAAASDVSTSSGEHDVRPVAFEPGGYYAEPVPVRLSKSLEPLPSELLDNPMNLLYFHHFINHTGRILVAHDCPENPFRGILPQMAVCNTQLLHLLLAFSASHRARLLGHPEPVNRIAQWMTDVLPALRRALDEPSPMSPGSTDPADPTSLAPLATAIMLASLEIVSPSLSSFSIPWYSHLSMARRLILATGGLDKLAQRADGARDRAIFFLSRWFAYLDVLGALSDCRLSTPLYDAYLEDGGGRWLVNRHNEEVYQIDCLFGFSGRCIALLAQVAELVNRCDNERIDSITNKVREDWAPSESIRQQAADLEVRLIASANTVYRGCNHYVNTPGLPGTESTPRQTDEDVAEIYATNEAFHWAGLIQLSRRVLGLPSSHPSVQALVERTTEALRHVRKGSTAEGCLLYPSFCAGAEAQDEATRALFADRLQHTERWGIGNVQRARRVMQAAWDTGLPWEVLTEGEFLG